MRFGIGPRRPVLLKRLDECVHAGRAQRET